MSAAMLTSVALLFLCVLGFSLASCSNSIVYGSNDVIDQVYSENISSSKRRKKHLTHRKNMMQISSDSGTRKQNHRLLQDKNNHFKSLKFIQVQKMNKFPAYEKRSQTQSGKAPMA